LPLGLLKQALAEVGMSNLDQSRGALAHRLAEEIRNSELGHHIMHIRACQRDSFTCEKGRPDAGLFAVVRRRSQANDRLAPARCGGAAVKVGLGGDAAVELALVLVSTDLAGQVDDESLGQRRHFVVLRHHCGIGDILDRPKLKQRVIVQKLIKPTRTDAEAGDDLAGMQSLMAPGDHALFNEIEVGGGDDVRVNAEVSAVMQVLQSLIGNTPESNV
jgi:hypothetical protein